MHCLGAVTGGSPSPNGVGGRGGILSVFRALGVLVCEGRIQGPPRGYKEGPHCAPPMQAAPNGHVCDEDDYLCNRYLVLVREIADRTAIGSFLCVEVLLCSDCPCGLAKATCKHPVWPLPSLSISPWQHTSEMLLEYWCICVVPSKSPEMMNYQGLYQAVRSRLHFSQVAAWWSRSNGNAPSYIATRVVPYKDDNLRKFRESPMEHTFPLAGSGDGNSIKVTVWALPRMEEVPILTCPLHQSKEKDEEGVARALTPTKAIPVTTAPQANDGLVLPVLVDDRLQTPCNKPGKHHCSCEEDDGSPPSPSIPRPNGERKRRRSLPCGPADNCVAFQQIPLPSVQESTAQELNSSSSYPKSSSEMTNNRAGVFKSAQSKGPRLQDDEVRNRNNINSDNLERCFKTQLSIEESEGNVEKRYKRTVETSVSEKDEKTNNSCKKDNPEKINAAKPPEKNGLFDNLIPFNPSLPWSFVESWNNANSKCAFQSLRASKDCHFNDLDRMYKPAFKDSSHAIDPFRQSSPFHESNPGPSTYNQLKSKQDPACTVHQSCSKVPNKLVTSESISPGKDALECDKESAGKVRGKPKDLSQLMSKLAFPEDKEKREEGGILEWFSKVPGKVLGVTPSTGYVDSKEKTNLKSQESTNEVKLKNCNLELSQREFDEVLAVLRTRTPSGRRRASLKTVKRRDRSEKAVEDGSQGKLNLENAEFVGRATNNIVNRAKSCDDCSHKLCKKNEHKLSCVNQSYCNKNIYNPAQQKQDKLASGIHGDLEKCNNEKSECLQSVSNKADILLGAILRTSKDRKGTCDTFNGTRPQCNLAREEGEMNSSTENGGDRRNLERVHYEDEKSLSVGLNKRFNRFRQLFKKEQERKVTTAGFQESLPSFALNALGFNNAQPHEVPRDSKAKRRIDFANFEERNDKYSVKVEKRDEEEEVSTNGAHQNSRIHSTNSKEDGRCENGMDGEVSAREDRSRLYSTKEEDYVDEGIERGGKRECKEAARSEKSSFVYLQNGYASSKLRSNNNNNNKDGVSEEEDEAPDKSVPSAIEQERFRRSLENAASMVFHSRTGLPLTSSPAPLRRGSCCFDYDSSLNSVSSKRSALFELNTPPSPGAVSLEETDRETENAGEEAQRRRTATRSRPQSHALLGSFEESALNGRLEPVSTVHGFTAELGASGSFCPKHRKLPVTVFFYTLGDNDKVSTPYLAHINLGKKGYQVPRSGTIQVTLLNPLGTVVKMFVVMYDLSDMPARSHTFLRQRTLRDKTLRYLVHLRFMSGKTGRIYLHTDIRMIICRKSDVDTASDFGSEPPKELRSYVHGPTNPKFSPRC